MKAFAPKPNYKAILIVWAFLVVITLYSFITQTILPVFRRGQVFFGITGILGYMTIILGVSLLSYGAFLFVINTSILFGLSGKVSQNVSTLRNKSKSRKIKSKARKENFMFLIEAWKPSFIYFGLAVLLIVCGSIMTNISDGTIIFK